MNAWIVFDRKTGAWDGQYRDKEMAQESLDSLTKGIPQADWVLQELFSPIDLLEDDFWVNIYEKEYLKGLNA